MKKNKISLIVVLFSSMIIIRCNNVHSQDLFDVNRRPSLSVIEKNGYNHAKEVDLSYHIKTHEKMTIGYLYDNDKGDNLLSKNWIYPIDSLNLNQRSIEELLFPYGFQFITSISKRDDGGILFCMRNDDFKVFICETVRDVSGWSLVVTYYYPKD